MKNSCIMTAICCTIISASALAASPIPSFDKEAVTTHPYNRTGQQEAVVDKEQLGDGYRPGNTGTEEQPAFFIRNIKLNDYLLPDPYGQLQGILDRYSNRSVTVEELGLLAEEVTAYTRSCGYTVTQAVVPPQEIVDGELELKVYIASFDAVGIAKNESAVADRVLQGFTKSLKSGEVITDKKLELVMNNLNDLPGVIARGVLRPGSRPVTTSLDMEVLERRVWNNFVYVDNGGSKTSGRWRYGLHTEYNNPGNQGDKISISGSLSNNHTKNYSISYEAPLNFHGSRIGFGVSRSEYDIGWQDDFLNPSGESESISIYGLTPVYRDKSKRVTAIYGYDYRDIEDNMDIKLADALHFSSKNEKRAHVAHIGLSASEYLPNRFTSGNLIYWYGDIDTKDMDAYYDGGYHKLTADFNHVRYWSRWNLRLEAHAQLANRGLDGSERFYLGGMDAVRAYPASDTSGDVGYNASLELRRATDVKGLEVAAFVDVGEVTNNKGYNEHDTLAGWGVGLRYAVPQEWYAQIDYARKINGHDDYSEEKNKNGRWWFQLYKMF